MSPNHELCAFTLTTEDCHAATHIRKIQTGKTVAFHSFYPRAGLLLHLDYLQVDDFWARVKGQLRSFAEETIDSLEGVEAFEWYNDSCSLVYTVCSTDLRPDKVSFPSVALSLCGRGCRDEDKSSNLTSMHGLQSRGHRKISY